MSTRPLARKQTSTHMQQFVFTTVPLTDHVKHAFRMKNAIMRRTRCTCQQIKTNTAFLFVRDRINTMSTWNCPCINVVFFLVNCGSVNIYRVCGSRAALLGQLLVVISCWHGLPQTKVNPGKFFDKKFLFAVCQFSSVFKGMCSHCCNKSLAVFVITKCFKMTERKGQGLNEFIHCLVYLSVFTYRWRLSNMVNEKKALLGVVIRNIVFSFTIIKLSVHVDDSGTVIIQFYYLV